MSVISSRKPCCKRSRGMISFSIFLMKSPPRSAFKCMDTLRANMELSWATRPRERFRGKHRSGRPESSLDRTSRIGHFTNLVKYLGFVLGCALLCLLIRKGNNRGRLFCDSTAAERAGPGTAGPGGRRRGHRVLYLPTADTKESASRGRSHGPVREDERILEAAEGTTFG